ncbi:MAG: helix-turn-helix domain-containing protein [Leptolyngbya sp. SIO1D8]|nr:helix-turn-helix domain-containing protein [Leptolyngbya sp. SIO1D8]
MNSNPSFAESSQVSSATTVLKQLMATAEIPSYRALCRAAGVSEWAIKQLRKDRIAHMRIETLQKLAAALHLSLSGLLRHFGAIDANLSEKGTLSEAASIQSTETHAADSRDRIAALEAEYQRLQTQMAEQEIVLRQRFQQEVLTLIEPWLLQWPTVTHAVEKNPDLPATHLIPLVQPVQNLLTQWGIMAIAPVGSEIPYNPQQHQLMSGAAAPGTPVRIRYTGFRQEDTLLHRAKVSPVE